MDYIELSYCQVGLAALLIVINAAISVALRLGLARSLLIASLRTVGQLFLIGIILESVFALNEWRSVMTLMVAMTLIAGASAVGRTGRRYRGVWFNSIVSVWASSWLVTAYAIFAIVRVEPWYLPQYSIPLLGMILGNTLNGISLGLGRLTDELVAKRDEVESRLALGATRWEAARPAVQEAIRTGMVPMINSMMVVGVVSLPGMMTGQLLSGIQPVQAVKYQIVIMFLIASGTALGTVAIVLLSYLRLFDSSHRFLSSRLR
jgi:putative ABC transport system permease protein